MASTYLERNMTGNTASTKMTFSCWLKKSNPATDGRVCLLYTSPSPRDVEESRMPSSA